MENLEKNIQEKLERLIKKVQDKTIDSDDINDLELLAELNINTANFLLGVIYAKGINVNADRNTATRYFDLAAVNANYELLEEIEKQRLLLK